MAGGGSRASLPARRRRPFPPGGGDGIEHRDEKPEPESTRTRAPGREKRPLAGLCTQEAFC